MNHGNKINHLGRTASHRKALIANMASSLILHKKIKTTVAKAKMLRMYVEPLITKAKTDTTHSRRMVFKALKHKDPVRELFGEVAAKIADRPGGYTRILKIGNRLGDNAEMCIIELVDFNELYTTGTKKAAGKTRRRRGGKKSEATEATEVSAAPKKKAKAAATDAEVSTPETSSSSKKDDDNNGENQAE